jgi:hypothetical protein
VILKITSVRPRPINGSAIGAPMDIRRARWRQRRGSRSRPHEHGCRLRGGSPSTRSRSTGALTWRVRYLLAWSGHLALAAWDAPARWCSRQEWVTRSGGLRMQLYSRNIRSLVAPLAVIVVLIAAVPLVPAVAAGGSGRTYTVKTVASSGIHAPRSLPRRRQVWRDRLRARTWCGTTAIRAAAPSGAVRACRDDPHRQRLRELGGEVGAPAIGDGVEQLGHNGADRVLHARDRRRQENAQKSSSAL